MIFRVISRAFGSIWHLKHLCQTTRSPLIKRMLIGVYGLYQYENNSSVAWDSIFRGVPCFPHGMKSIFISGVAEIGKNCVIFQQVTIGSNTLSDSKGTGAPVIGNDCYIGAGAKIVGKVRIGNNVRVGANAVVFSDVPDNAVVMVGEQKMFAKNRPQDNRFYSRHKMWVFFDDGKWVPVSDAIVLSKLQGMSTS